MLETNITYSDLLKYEGSLSSLDASFSTNGAAKINEAKIVLERHVQNRGLKLRNLCKRLTLTDATKSEEDDVERTRLVLVLSGTVGTTTFVLQGTNDSDNKTWTTITTADTLSYTTTGTKTTTFSDTYKYYKLTKTGTATVSAYLVETSWEMVLIFLTLKMIFQEYQALVGDNWEEKSKYYDMMFEESFKNAAYSYDSDEDGEADKLTYNQTTFRR